MPLNENAKARLVAKLPAECASRAPGKELKLRHRKLSQALRRAQRSLADLDATKTDGPAAERERLAKLQRLQQEERGLREELAEIEKAALALEW